jgi:hypothetical protein
MTITKVGKNQYKRPSGVIATKDNKYFYWSCTVSGIATFANAIRWKKVLEVYKTEENLVKTFVCREAKKYVAAGYTEAQIRKLVVDHKGDLPKLNPTMKRDPRIPKKVRKARNKAVKVEKVVEVVNGVETEVVKKVYVWSHDPQNYFRTDNAPYDISESTKEACMYPNRHLDDECRGCSVYDLCRCPTKFTQADWDKSAKKKQPSAVIKPIPSFADDELPQAVVA